MYSVLRDAVHGGVVLGCTGACLPAPPLQTSIASPSLLFTSMPVVLARCGLMPQRDMVRKGEAGRGWARKGGLALLGTCLSALLGGFLSLDH